MAEEKEEKKEKKEKKKERSLTTPIILVLAVIVAFLGGMFVTRYLGQGGEEVASPSPSPAEEVELTSTIGRFTVTGEEICEEDGLPLVYFFGSESCPHCSWEHPIFEEVMSQFEGLIAFHNNMDDLEADMEVFQKYGQINQGGIPFLVLGCRYVRVGSGENFGEEEEASYLTALTCQLTEGEPEAVCEEVADLIEQIE